MHPDPAHCRGERTGLTHLGRRGDARLDASEVSADESSLSDSISCSNGARGRASREDEPGVAPEWFYKGNGHIVAAPARAGDAGLPRWLRGEPELDRPSYLIGADGAPYRLVCESATNARPRHRGAKNYLSSRIPNCVAVDRARASHRRPAGRYCKARAAFVAALKSYGRNRSTGAANMCHRCESRVSPISQYVKHRRRRPASALLGTAT